MFRQQPYWYQRGLTQIATRFSSIFANSPPNLSLLPSFPSQDLLPDGRFLTPVAGLHFVLHLFDQTSLLIKTNAASGDAKLAQVQEQVRHHEDRMTYLENSHGGLQKQMSHKVAVDAEFNDWVQNRNDEDWFVVRGLPRLNVSRQDFPNASRRQVADMIKLVLNAHRVRLDFEVIFVFNPFSRNDNGPTLYNVKMDSAYSSKKIRDLFSGFFRHQRAVQLPSSLKGVEVRNKITLETKIRISILRQLGLRYQASNPGSSFKVRGFDPRPTLVTTPPRSSTERQRTYNFIQAVTSLPSNFSDESLAAIFQSVGDRFRGKLQSLFVILNDDDHDRCLELAKKHSRAPRRGQAHASGPGSGFAPTSSSTVSFGLVSGPGAGMEVESETLTGHVRGAGSGFGLESNLLTSLRSPPPPPSTHPDEDLETRFSHAHETEASRAHDKRVRQRREHERQPTPSPDRRGLKRRHQSSSPDSRRSKKSSKRSRRRASSSSSSGSCSSRGSGHKRHKKSKSSKHKN